MMFRRNIKLIISLIIFSAILFISTKPSYSEDEENCILCHSHKNLSVIDANGEEKSFYVNNDDYKHSVHNKASCRGCHTSITEVPHKKTYQRVNCGIKCHLAKSLSLGSFSHQKIYDSFMTSAHGTVSDDTPDCLYCHVNNVLKDSEKESRLEILAGCARCHKDDEKMKEHDIAPNVVSTYLKSSHAKVFFLEPQSSVICSDCHSLHNISTKEAETSPINEANISRTCAGQETSIKGCHLTFSPDFLQSFDHDVNKTGDEFSISGIEKFVRYLIIAVFYMFCILNILKIIRE
ncbi:cytochrome c3 family protein [Thermodesulfobacteriota bacterium]